MLLSKSGLTAIFLACAVQSSISMAATGDSATITIKGKVLANTCEVAVGEMMNMGDIKETQFSNGKYQRGAEKAITLSSCGSSVTGIQLKVSEPVMVDPVNGMTVTLFDKEGTTELKANELSKEIAMTPGSDSYDVLLTPVIKSTNGTKITPGEIVATIQTSITYL